MRSDQATLSRLPSLLAFLVLAAILAGCGGPSGPAIEIPANPESAPQANLESLYNRLSRNLAAAKPGSDSAIQLGDDLKTVGGELAKRAAAEIRTELSQVERVDGQIPLGALERIQPRLDSVSRWDAMEHARISSEIKQEIAGTKRAIQTRETALANSSDDEVLKRIQLLSDLSRLSGTGSAKQAEYSSKRDAIMRQVSQEAEDAIKNEDYERAQNLLGIVQEVNPDDELARKQKCEVDGQVIVKRFSVALETGRVTRSVSMLEDFSETDCFNDIRDGLAESAGPMAEAFAALGQEAAGKGQMGLAYQRFRDATTIQRLLLDQTGQPEGVAPFLKKVDTAYQRAFKAEEYGLAWGYLNVMKEFGPTTPQIVQRTRKTKDEVERRAVRGLTAYPFADPPSSTTKVGDAVANKVVQHIFKTLPTDVRIVEREQLERILEECKRNNACGALDTADFIVQGSILDAKVETTEKSGSETRRVNTGKETLTNPEYTRWTQMRERDREKTPQPPTTITREVTEDVTMKVTSVRKVGIISVSYRIVDAESGRVLFTDSIQTKQEFQDEGREGVTLGNFSQETDFVELPPDIEILSGADGLADKISEEIGVKLVDFLQNPEDDYADDAKRFVKEGDYIGAARKAAYAIVLRERKSKEIGELREDLKSYAMSSPTL